MEKPKFKMSKEEMLDFNDACFDAAAACPQYRGEWAFDDREILLGLIKPKDLVKSWLNCDTLWHSGYYKELSPDALDVFNAYKQYKAQKTIWKQAQAGK